MVTAIAFALRSANAKSWKIIMQNEYQSLWQELTRFKSLKGRVLGALSLCSIASTGQLVRFALMLTEEERRRNDGLKSKEREYLNAVYEIEKLHSEENLLGVIRNYQMPKCFENKQTDVWYLTKRGLDIARLGSDHLTRYAAHGLPMGRKTNRIPHEITVTESFLKLAEKYEISEWTPERELKRRLMLLRNERLKAGVRAPNPTMRGEETGDFKAVLKLHDDPATGKEFEIEGEAALGYRREQIEQKPDGMVWFTPSRLQKEAIENIKGQQRVRTIWMLGNVVEPLSVLAIATPGSGSKNKGEKKRTGLENKIIKILRKNNEAFSYQALAHLVKSDQGNVNKALNALAQRKIVVAVPVKLKPAQQVGRPWKLFALAETVTAELNKWSEKVNLAVLSASIIRFSDSGYEYQNYSKEFNEALFHHLEKGGGDRVKVIVDNPKLTVGRLIELVAYAGVERADGKLTVIVAASSTERTLELRDKVPQQTIFDAETKHLHEPAQAAKSQPASRSAWQ